MQQTENKKSTRSENSSSVAAQVQRSCVRYRNGERTHTVLRSEQTYPDCVQDPRA